MTRVDIRLETILIIVAVALMIFGFYAGQFIWGIIFAGVLILGSIGIWLFRYFRKLLKIDE